MRSRRFFGAALVCGLVCIAPPKSRAAGPLDSPDIIVGDLHQIFSFGTEGSIAVFSVGTTSCNIGTAPALWVASTPQHPVIGQNMFRLKDGRFEQIGMSWLKHGFAALAENLCNTCKNPHDSSKLGVGCSDPYGAFLNGRQDILGPRSQVDPFTGIFTFPRQLDDPTCSECGIAERRIQVDVADLDPAQNEGALYFVEGQYVTADDAQANNGANNNSYRLIEFISTVGCFGLASGDFCAALRGETFREAPAIQAWADNTPGVELTEIWVPGEGLFILGAKAEDLGDGEWQYDYALQNLTSDRAASSFLVPLPKNVTSLSAFYFRDVDHHSGEPYDPTDWLVDSFSPRGIRWHSAETEAENPNANALRWGTMFNFSFQTNVAPAPTRIEIELFKSGFPSQVTAATIGPDPGSLDCNDNGVDDRCDLDCSLSICLEGCVELADCDSNGIPDECDPDCNTNGQVDLCEIASGVANDCNLNGIPDDCEPDCDANGVADDCEILPDTDGDGLDDCLDECDETTIVRCVCPDRGVCCLPIIGCLENFLREQCLEDGGTPDCFPVPCVAGCECPVPSPVAPLLLTDDNGLLVESTMNRFISFKAGDPGRSQAIRVEVVDAPEGFTQFIGTVLWAGTPKTINELSGRLEPGKDNLVAVKLGCQPVFRDWSSLGGIHAYHSAVVPGGEYEVRVLEEDCSESDPSRLSTPFTVSTTKWGDVSGQFSISMRLWTAPDGTVDVTFDLLAMLEKFKNLPHSMSKVRADLEPSTPDLLINITDIVAVQSAFRGVPYPFLPDVSPCSSPTVPR